jgi:hypothetical protein
MPFRLSILDEERWAPLTLIEAGSDRRARHQAPLEEEESVTEILEWTC